MNSTQGSIHVDGFELGYRIEGTGQPAIVVGSAVYYPRTFSARLRDYLQLIFMDHRGFGKATAPFTEAAFELDKLVDDIEALRKHLGLDQVMIIGHSGHGYMALEYAQHYPDSVSHVVLMCLSPDSSPAAFEAADRYLAESVCQERKVLLAESMARLPAELEADPRNRFIIRSLRFGPAIWYDPAFDASALWHGVEVIPEMFDYVWGQVFQRIDITGGLDALHKPVFLALGRYDYWNPPHLWERVRGQFYDLRVRVFEQSGHAPQLEEPDHFDRELLAWLVEKAQP